MRVEDIEVRADDRLSRPYQVVGPIEARVTAGAAWNKARTVEDVNSKLREVALKMGANAVINVQYSRGPSATSWKAMTATGIAVLAQPNDRQCPHCAESIKCEASVCRFCGRNVEPTARWANDPYERHELRYWNGVMWTEHVSDGGTIAIDRPV